MLYGIWQGRNARVWDNKICTGAVVIDGCFKLVKDWRAARGTLKELKSQNQIKVNVTSRRWNPPEVGTYKINVDASWYPGSNAFSIGMLLRDHTANFIEGRCPSLPQVDAILEAESLGIKEALSWVKSQEKKNGDSGVGLEISY